MGKTGGGSSSSWLTAVKRAFRSPTKDTTNDDTRRSTRPRHHQDPSQPQPQPHELNTNKKKEKKGWLFRKPTNHEATHQTITQNAANNNNTSVSQEEQKRHAIAVAVATAKAAEAAVATAQAAVEVARLAGPPPSFYAREHHAATIIQTGFRGYLARRALRALKGVVKLQALVRGHNVRNQAKMTLRCMQALVRVQSRVLDQRVRQSNDGTSSRKSTFSDTNILWESHHLHDTYDRKSLSRDGSSMADEWDERAHTVEEVKAMLHHRKESAALKRERNLSQAFSQQMWRNNRNKSFGNEEEIGVKEQPQWQNKWTPAKPWESNKARSSTDGKDTFFKTVEVDNTSQSQAPYSFLPLQHHQRSNSHFSASPLHRAHQNSPRHHTPSPSKLISIQARSASPRYNRPQTPSVRSNYFYNGPVGLNGPVPSYMAETESARARVRAQSAPRQRPATPERERGVMSAAKKRLSYNGGCQMKSPSFKSMSGVMQMGVEQQSNYSSCYTDSLGGEISPSSTTDLRRWLR